MQLSWLTQQLTIYLVDQVYYFSYLRDFTERTYEYEILQSRKLLIKIVWRSLVLSLHYLCTTHVTEHMKRNVIDFINIL